MVEKGAWFINRAFSVAMSKKGSWLKIRVTKKGAWFTIVLIQSR